jgi:predicted TIM-barrel fold metal-dependent hydrolase
MLTIDAQIHLWEADRPDRPWPAGAIPNIPEPMTAERFLKMMDEASVDRAVIAPPWVAGFNPAYALECAAKYPQRFGITGRYDLDDPDSASALPTWLSRPGMLGIRVGLPAANAPRWRDSGAWETLLSGAERYNIPISLFTPNGLDGVEDDVQRHPNLKLIIDHLNIVQAPHEAWPERLAELTALAKYPNVGVKVSALPAFAQQQYPYPALHEPIKQVHAAFSARRMMWGSDQTVQMERGTATYPQSVDLIREVAAEFLPAADIEWILGKSLTRWLNWP